MLYVDIFGEKKIYLEDLRILKKVKDFNITPFVKLYRLQCEVENTLYYLNISLLSSARYFNQKNIDDLVNEVKAKFDLFYSVYAEYQKLEYVYQFLGMGDIFRKNGLKRVAHNYE